MSVETQEALRAAKKRFEGGHIKKAELDAAQAAHDAGEGTKKPASRSRTKSAAKPEDAE